MLRSDFMWPAGAAICRVIYDEREQARAVESVFDVWNVHYQTLPPGDLSESAVDQGAYCLATLSRICKNPCFREEREWRLIYVPAYDHPGDHDDHNPPTVRHNITGPHTYLRVDAIEVPYYEWRFAANRTLLPVADVILGAKNTVPLDEVTVLLGSVGLHGTTVQSLVRPIAKTNAEMHSINAGGHL